MALPINVLEQVQTYQEGGLAYLQNLCVFISTANTKFKEFEKREANLGDTVTFDLPPRYTTTNSLVANFQPSTQRAQSLTVDKAANTSYAFSDQQFIFNVKDYMQKFGKSAIAELATKVEADVAQNAILNHTYRFYGDGVAAINSYSQLALGLAYYRNFGAPKMNAKGYLPDLAVPAIINSGLSQFATKRNDETANSWELGDFSQCSWYESNLLPIHVAGSEGQAGTTLTVVSTNDPTGANITQITVSGATASTGTVLTGDLGQFQDGVSGQPDLRFLTFIGHQVSGSPVQFRVTADATADGSGNVVLNVFPALVATPGAEQNINNNIVAGMQLKLLPSHRAGLIMSGDPLFLAMPKLPGQSPYTSSAEYDPDTGVSMRMTYGSLFGQNQSGMIHDVIWGSTLVDEYAMRVIFPL